jgi:hypothetical protein
MTSIMKHFRLQRSDLFLPLELERALRKAAAGRWQRSQESLTRDLGNSLNKLPVSKWPRKDKVLSFWRAVGDLKTMFKRPGLVSGS